MRKFFPKVTESRSVSAGCGLPAVVQLHEWPLNVAPEYMAPALQDASLGSHLQIERFRRRVSLALTPHGLDPTSSISQHERLALYRLLNSTFIDLERETETLSPQRNHFLSQLVLFTLMSEC